MTARPDISAQRPIAEKFVFNSFGCKGENVSPALEWTDPPAGTKSFAVLVHETAHELLHRGDRRKETTHTVRETEAEAVAFVVSTAIGLDANTSSSDYIQLHAGDKATLAESLAFIQQTASVILQAIGPGGIAVANS